MAATKGKTRDMNPTSITEPVQDAAVPMPGPETARTFKAALHGGGGSTQTATRRDAEASATATRTARPKAAPPVTPEAEIDPAAPDLGGWVPNPQWTMITPEMAADMLTYNHENRKILASRVALYARDMAAGHWVPSNDAICIDPDGMLLNGQHRLSAIVRSGKTVGMVVIRDMPKAYMAAMDRLAVRTMANVLGFQGEHNPSGLAAATRKAVLHERGQSVRGAGVSVAEVNDFLARHPEMRRSVAVAGTKKNGVEVGCAPSTLSLAHFLIAQVVGQYDADRYVEKLVTRAEPARSAVHAVVRRMRPIHANDADGQLLLLIKGWNAWARGQELGTFQIPKGAESRAIPAIVQRTTRDESLEGEGDLG